MVTELLGKIRRGMRKPPGVIARRLWDELRAETERFRAGPRARRLDEGKLCRALGDPSLDALWSRLAHRPYFARTAVHDQEKYDQLCAGERRLVLARAEDALAYRVNLLGSGPIALGPQTDWHKDYKTGRVWPSSYAPRLSYCNPNDPSDVKFPWELSRLQWLIPAGQAYALTGDERYAVGVREVLDHWIAHNPYAYSVNWACTMEAALRILTWSWFFHVFHHSQAWRDQGFRFRFLHALYLHGDYTERHLERSDINGNHFTADAAALVFAGLFFGSGAAPRRWQETGWTLLGDELPKQVHPDGVDFEASVAYHRLVLELFFLPALYRQTCGLAIPEDYRARVIGMARFAAAYSRPGASVPLVGDADDARALPMGQQAINDHRYLAGLVGTAWDAPELISQCSGSSGEVFWLLDREPARLAVSGATPRSQAFPHGGFYIMRNERDHVFIDCGPVGSAGRGGHGHNDCLSFEAVLDGVHLVTDCGAYLYTASYVERNLFRSTAYHNTPQVDGEELNRFIRWDHLWTLHNDARAEVQQWRTDEEIDQLTGSHSGYQRLHDSVLPVRTITLDHRRHVLTVDDRFEGSGEHLVEVPLHLAPNIQAQVDSPGRVRLTSEQSSFVLLWGPMEHWELTIGAGRCSPSYGVVVAITRLVWRRRGPLQRLTAWIAPSAVAVEDGVGHVGLLDRGEHMDGRRE